jgi:hypothetical protein
MGEPVKTPILGVGRFAGVEPGIFCGIFYRLGCDYRAARLWSRLRGSARLEYGARVSQSSSTSGRVGCVWSNSAEYSGGACGIPPSPIKLIFAPVSSYGWALHRGMIKTCFGQLWKFGYLPKHFCFLTNGALIPIVGGRNHWWWLWNTRRG